jgi:orotate phosphoribosyltransferase
MGPQGAPGLLELIDGRHGHFRLESGHHGELWLDLDALFVHPARLVPFVENLAHQLADLVAPTAVCGPLLGGALLAGAVATRLDVEFYVAEPIARADGDRELFGARYAVPDTVRDRLRGQRVAVIDDVVNAASATRATVSDLRAAGAHVVAIGALLMLGTSAAEYADQEGLALLYAAAMPNRIWEPSGCPLCASGEPLEDPGGRSE